MHVLLESYRYLPYSEAFLIQKHKKNSSNIFSLKKTGLWSLDPDGIRNFNTIESNLEGVCNCARYTVLDLLLCTIYETCVDKGAKGVDIMQDCESCSDPCVTEVQTASTTVTSVGSGRRNLTENYSKLNFFPLSVPRIHGSGL